ncbi:MFS transporter [Herbaspirillum sp. WGmk3]|uniref:MFS transporter n=1 Tax=Herbaspirillum sp. WGmk3 TaxID=2919925 RepID=UPI002091C5EE|nr:MFS transporter [Herbaspirillum sp. WGmk3]MCO4854867.1 MFS transporter [Herbaspirillum sp. WGmk3]
MHPFTALLLLTAIQIATSFAATAVLTISPLLAETLGISARWVGVYTAVLYAAAACSSIWFGNRVHRLGAFQVSRWCLALCALGMLLIATTHVAGVLTGSVLMGMGYGGITPASSYFLSQSGPLKNRSLLFSIRQSGVPAGAALAALLVPVMTQHVGLLWTFVVPGLIGLLGAAAFNSKSAQDHDPASAANQGAASADNVWSLLRSHPPLRILAWVAFLFSGLQVTAIAMLVPFLHGFQQMSIEQAAMLLTLFNLVGVVFRLVWGRCVDRGVPALRMLAVSGLLGMLGFGILAWSAFAALPGLLLTLAAAALGVAVVAWNGVLFSEIAILVPREQVGRATGLCVFAGFVGVVLIPAVLSLAITQRTASGLVFGLGAVLSMAVGWQTWYRASRSRKT